ncbi:hypothetical protein L4D09_13190 [Photobacterium makurazakiensis]|uniref:hypothetical protein n=1 Tax=Photobacterium makurazakiensis TaxID=2910234 RepID=UPI003D13A909
MYKYFPIILLAGCADPYAPNYQDFPELNKPQVQLEKKTDSSIIDLFHSPVQSVPPVGTTNIVRVGNDVLNDGSVKIHERFEIYDLVTFGFNGVYAEKGKYEVTDQDDDWYYISGSNGVGLTDLVSPVDGQLKVNKSSGQLAATVGFKTYVDTVKAKKLEATTVLDSNAKNRITYQGIEGGSWVVFQYSTTDKQVDYFLNGISFKNDMTMSKRVVFQGAELEIIDFNKDSIEYRVISGFNI